MAISPGCFCFRSRLRGLGAFVAVCLLAGCGTLTTPAQPEPGLWAAEAKSCSRWFEALDASTDSAGVRDGGAYRIPGFAYLRTDRFLASFRDEVADKPDNADSPDKPEAFSAWVGRLKQLDQSAREAELRNLPLQFLPLAGVADKADVAATTRRCADLLAGTLGILRAERALLVKRAQVPDDYADWRRTVGLYPLTRIPFLKGVERWQRETAQTFGQNEKRNDQASREAGQASPPVPAPVSVYAPAGPPMSAQRIAALYANLKKDALGIPQPDDQAQALLLQAYAPLFEIETTGAYDRFGALSWGTAQSPEVDPSQAVVYQRLAYTRYKGQTLLQLVYSVWFSERPPSTAVDLLSGKLDSVVLRVTLGSSGTPLIYDTIHSCGCYHLFFPTSGVTPRSAPQAGMEWAFVPMTLPAPQAGQRVVLRLASRSHYAVGLRPAALVDSAVGLRPAMAGDDTTAARYAVADDNALRNLPLTDRPGEPPGMTRSAFWPNGIVPGTERGERLLFWPMGIDSPGAMRQWGRQPTAFVGRRHFDDADLLSLRFDLGSP